MGREKNATIRLCCPVQLADGLLSEVTMRRPTVGDILDHPIRDVQDMAGELRLYACLCNIHEDDMRKVDMEDYAKIQQQYLFFRGLAAPERADALRPAPEQVDWLGS